MVQPIEKKIFFAAVISLINKLEQFQLEKNFDLSNSGAIISVCSDIPHLITVVMQ